MEDKDIKETNVKSTIDAVTGLVKAVPIYQDTLQPAAKQVGKSLETITKVVNIALSPIKAIVWGYDKIEDFITKRVSEKLCNVPEENIITPLPQIAGPAIETLKYVGHDENLRELYANLIANAMDKSTSYKVHPSFVEILKNLASDEALLLQAFINNRSHPLIDIQAVDNTNNRGHLVMYSNHSHFYKKVDLVNRQLVPVYLDNLCRLGIAIIPSLESISAPNTYEPLESDEALENLKKQIEDDMKCTVKFKRKTIMLTDFGSQFITNVVEEKNKTSANKSSYYVYSK